MTSTAFDAIDRLRATLQDHPLHPGGEDSGAGYDIRPADSGAVTTAARNIAQLEDTIVAVATPNGRGALALIRLSGPAAFSIAEKHLRPAGLSQPRVPQLCTVHHGDEVLDQALVTLFPGPNSFTGDDTVEISTHGGYLVPSSVVAALISSGARQAVPGEFTRRAVLNGKLDILQAEAIGDLIDARSHAMQRTALGQLDGGLSAVCSS